MSNATYIVVVHAQVRLVRERILAPENDLSNGPGVLADREKG